MSWTDRLAEAAYRSPGGARFTFLYENVAEEVTKRGRAFDFPDAAGTYVQTRGRTGRRFPMRCIFWGPDCDLAASGFMDALMEDGYGVLEHPMYGAADVVPFGPITRRDDLKTAANQAILELTFWESFTLAYPSTSTDPASVVSAAVTAFNSAAANNFAGTVQLGSAGVISSFKTEVEALLDAASAVLQPIAAVQQEVERQFSDVEASINAAIDTLVGDPLTLAFQTQIMLEAPARAATAITDRLDAYENLLEGITTGRDTVVEDASGTGGITTRQRELLASAFRARELYVTTYVVSAVQSVTEHTFTNRSEVLESSDRLLELLDTAVTWQDEQLAVLELGDAGQAYEQMLRAVSVASAFLVEISFTLEQERRLVLTDARTMVDLCAELYGDISDERLNFFWRSNQLKGTELLEIPRGREVVYYV